MLLTVPEVANELRITNAAVYQFVKRGLLPGVRVGRCVRIDKRALHAFLAAGRRRASGGAGGEATCRGRTGA